MRQSEQHVSIIFEPPFYIILFENFIDGKYSVAKEIIGTTDPTHSDLSIFFEQLNFDQIQFSEPVLEDNQKEFKKISFKKQLKLSKIATEKKTLHTYTKASEQLKLLQELNKKEKKEVSKKEKEELLALKFNQRVQKSKEKHKGH
jgi:hypothetical protein